MTDRKTFADMVHAGEIKAEDAVRVAFQTIAEWHGSGSDLSVYEYMGITAEQYAEFARRPERLTRILRVEKLCNMCGLSLMLDEPHYDGYYGLVDVEAHGHYASTPGNGAGALDDMTTYRFSLCEFCVDHVMSLMVIKPGVNEHDVDMNNCGDREEFRPAAQRVHDDDWRSMKDKFFTEYEKRNAARKLYNDPLWRSVMNAPLAAGPVPEAERIVVDAAKAGGELVDGAVVSAQVAALRRAPVVPFSGEERAMVDEIDASARWIPHDQFVEGLPRQVADAMRDTVSSDTVANTKSGS